MTDENVPNQNNGLPTGADQADLADRLVADHALDPALDSLLDDALSPSSVSGGIPSGLTDRIMAATVDLMGQPQASQDTSPAVIGRIGVSRIQQLRRFAAMLILFAWIGAAFIVVAVVRDADKALIENNMAAVEDVFDHVAQASPEMTAVGAVVAPIDTELDRLEVDIELAVSSTTTSWEDLAAEFEAELDLLKPDSPIISPM